MAFSPVPPDAKVCQAGIPDPVLQNAEATTEYKTTNHKILKQVPSALGNNCVEYAKSRAIVPTGVGTLEQKISKIRSKEIKEGSVGVTAEGSVGHLVVVEEVKEDTIIISEGNYHRGYITYREVPRSLIIGVYN